MTATTTSMFGLSSLSEDELMGLFMKFCSCLLNGDISSLNLASGYLYN